MQTPVLDQIADRVDRLLLRHEELARTNALLRSEVAQLTQERDSLLSRLSAARARIEALLARINDKSAPGNTDAGAKPSSP